MTLTITMEREKGKFLHQAEIFAIRIGSRSSIRLLSIVLIGVSAPNPRTDRNTIVLSHDFVTYASVQQMATREEYL